MIPFISKEEDSEKEKESSDTNSKIKHIILDSEEFKNFIKTFSNEITQDIIIELTSNPKTLSELNEKLDYDIEEISKNLERLLENSEIKSYTKSNKRNQNEIEEKIYEANYNTIIASKHKKKNNINNHLKDYLGKIIPIIIIVLLISHLINEYSTIKESHEALVQTLQEPIPILIVGPIEIPYTIVAGLFFMIGSIFGIVLVSLVHKYDKKVNRRNYEKP